MVQTKGKKILLTSADKACAEIIVMLLKAFGYDVLWIQGCASTVETISKIQPDLIIIDCDSVQMRSLGIIKTLKSDYRNAHIPVLLMIEKRNIRRDILQIEQGLDDYLTKPPDPIDLEVRIEMALRRTEHQFFANPLSRLPGSRMLEKVLGQRLQSSQVISFLYCDINNFKSFNDKYGYKAGDAVIMQTAHIITTAVKQSGTNTDFVFHIGGDDFVVLTQTRQEANIARFIIDEFDKLMPFHYSSLDRSRGFIRIKNRMGKINDLALMGMSISIVNNLHRKINNLVEFIEIAFEIKRYLKKHKHSRSLVNRRRADVHIEAEGHDEISRKEAISKRKRRIKEYRPLGQVLLEGNLIDSGQLESALNKHWNSGMRLGEALVDMNILSAKKLEGAFRKFKLNTDL